MVVTRAYCKNGIKVRGEKKLEVLIERPGALESSLLTCDKPPFPESL